MQTNVVPAGHTREYRMLDAAGVHDAIDVIKSFSASALVNVAETGPASV